MKRRRVAVSVIACVVIASIGGWLAGSRVRSQAEVAAATAAPEAAPILVPAEERVLTSTIVTRGTARFGSPTPVTLAVSAVKAEAGLATSLPAVGTSLGEGRSLMSSSGRPVLVLQGEVPAHRDLHVGTSGDDVHQLEEALARLGHDPGAVDGTFDEAAAAAVVRWYESEGWAPFEATPDQLAAIRAMELELAQVQGERLSAASRRTSPRPVAARARPWNGASPPRS